MGRPAAARAATAPGARDSWTCIARAAVAACAWAPPAVDAVSCARIARAALAAAALVLVALPARAQDDAAEPLALRYEAPAACQDAGAFFTQLRARTTRVRAPKDGETARALVVRVTTGGPGFIGHLHFEDAGATTSPRVFEMTSCAEVIEALNLSAALAVDPSASTAPATALPASPSQEPAPPPPPPPLVAPVAPAPSAERPSASSRAEPSSVDARFAAGVAVEGAALSSLVPSGRVFLEGTLREHASLFAPSVRVLVARSLDVDQSPKIGTASMTWTTGGIDACPIRVQIASTLTVRPCFEVAAGTLAAQASGVDDARNRSRAWVALDVHGRLAWDLARFLALEVEAGASAPLIRETFFFLPNNDVYLAPTIGFFGRAGASVRFP